MTQDLSRRLNEIEIRYTHQARLIDELSDELADANERIEFLEREVNRLRGMVSRLEPGIEQSPDE